MEPSQTVRLEQKCSSLHTHPLSQQSLSPSSFLSSSSEPSKPPASPCKLPPRPTQSGAAPGATAKVVSDATNEQASKSRAFELLSHIERSWAWGSPNSPGRKSVTLTSKPGTNEQMKRLSASSPRSHCPGVSYSQTLSTPFLSAVKSQCGTWRASAHRQAPQSEASISSPATENSAQL